MKESQSIRRLLDEFERLPGIGPKSAQRIVYWLLNAEPSEANRLADAISDVKKTVHFCTRCYNYAEGELCEMCADPARDQSQICVVSEPRDIGAIERTGEYRGLYHVLGGTISPMEGVTAEDLKIAELVRRLGDENVTEVILATDPNVEGETTAIYLSRIIKPLGIKVTRLASGLPVGGDLEFADEVTLGRAISARREL